MLKINNFVKKSTFFLFLFLILLVFPVVNGLTSNPSELIYDQDINNYKNISLVINNDDNYDLNDISFNFTIPAEYDPKVYLGFDTISALSSKSVIVSIKIPESISSGKMLAGYLLIHNSQTSLSVPIYTEEDSKLEIDKIKSYVGGKSETLSSGETLDVEPGQEVNLTIYIDNTFSDSDYEITDVYSSIYVDELFGPNSEVFESNSVDIDGDDTEKTKISFTIPKDAYDKRYRIDVKVKGNYINGGSHYDTTYFYIRVNRDDYDFDLSATLIPEKINCNEKDARLYIKLVNTGSRYVRNIYLTASNSDLQLSYNDSFDLSDNYDNHENKYEKQINLDLYKDKNFDPDKTLSYPITVKIIYNDLVDEKKVILTHIGCPKENSTFEVIYQKPKNISNDKNSYEEKSSNKLILPTISSKNIRDIFIFINILFMLGIIFIFVKVIKINKKPKKNKVIKKNTSKRKNIKKTKKNISKKTKK